MKKLSTILVTTTVLLAGCASTPKYDNFTSVQLQQTLDKFKAEQGRMVTPIRGKFKEVAAFKSSSVGSHGFTCSGTDTIKYVEHMNIHTHEDGTVTAKSIGSDCGTVGEPRTYSGLQTKNHLYLYSPSLYDITAYKIDELSGKLTKKGSYKSKNGTLVFNESRQNNETWSQGLGSNYSYKTTGFAPESLWSEVDRFERNIVVKKGGRAAGEFQWGKALALGVGAVAGGGLSLESDTQASVIAGIVLDSKADTSGTSNLNNAVETSLENNARRAAARTSLPSSSKDSATADTNPTPENKNIKVVEASPQASESKSLYTHSTSQCVAQLDRGPKAELDKLTLRAHPTPKLIPISDISIYSDLNSAHKLKSERFLRNKLESYAREIEREIGGGGITCTLTLQIPWNYDDAKARLDKTIAWGKRVDATSTVKIIYVDID